MSKHPNRLWAAALLLGWLFDFLFWDKPVGINFAIYAGLCVLFGLVLLLSERIVPDRRSLWLLVPLFFFAAVTAIRREPLTSFLGFGLTLFALSVFAITYLGGRWPQYAVLDYLGKYLGLAGSMLERPFSFSQEARKAQAESGQPKRSGRFWPVLRGLLIAVPVVAVFASLLASADAIFGQELQKLIELFRLENLPQYIFRTIYILVGAWFIAGIFLHAAFKSNDEKLVGVDKPAVQPFLGFTESAIVLGSVGALFLIFVVIQFQYFFGGNANIRIDGFTYSEYARRGFGELVAVAFFTLLLLLGLGSVTRRETEGQRRFFSGVGAGLVAMVLVMLVSAYQRLVLYESAYGFSRLRTYTHVVLFWIALLLVATIVLEILHQERRFAFAAVLAAIGFAASLSLLNVDGFIVKQNIARELEGNSQIQGDGGQARLDFQYFLNLSDDAIPPLVEAYQSASIPAATHNKLGAALACIRHQRGGPQSDRPWQGFHFSQFRADQALDAVGQQLDTYKIRDTNWPFIAIDPQGTKFECSPSYVD